ncbi:hypothetical protein HMPREF6745_0989 [Prevotella sp. oral taxon 472 str. F0295]|nr:hypothetical protein HMPREF6745_0989 [Prevotella sp. oral taxon 472 str. F0295]
MGWMVNVLTFLIAWANKSCLCVLWDKLKQRFAISLARAYIIRSKGQAMKL